MVSPVESGQCMLLEEEEVRDSGAPRRKAVLLVDDDVLKNWRNFIQYKGFEEFS